MRLALSLSAIAALFLVACGGAPPSPETPVSHPETPSAEATAAPTAVPSATAAVNAPPAAACPGKVDAPEGLAEVSDPDLLKMALGDPGKGGLCTGKVFEVVKPVSVFRVWNQAKVQTALGRWWSFGKPKGPVDAYRRDNAICPEWSDLNFYNECHLKVGAHIVVGPGQSAECKSTTYAASSTNQVFVNNDTRDKDHPKLLVEECTSGSVWP
ncbi:MAG: hypothetical protein U0359_24680 [Byssovorax sp.]